MLVACWLLPAAICRQCWRWRREAPSSTTTTDRTERGRLLHPAGGPRVDAPRRGRQADGATPSAGARAAGAAREVLALAPSPAPRASARPGRCIIEATVNRKVRRGCSRSRPGRRTDPRGGCFARKPTVILGPATCTARDCFRTRPVGARWSATTSIIHSGHEQEKRNSSTPFAAVLSSWLLRQRSRSARRSRSCPWSPLRWRATGRVRRRKRRSASPEYACAACPSRLSFVLLDSDVERAVGLRNPRARGTRAGEPRGNSDLSLSHKPRLRGGRAYRGRGVPPRTTARVRNHRQTCMYGRAGTMACHSAGVRSLPAT